VQAWSEQQEVHPMKPEVRHMMTDEVLAAVDQGRIPVVPIATLETHDPHLPVDVDLRCAEEVVLRAARLRPDLLLAFPSVGYGYTEHTMDFPGGYSIRPQVLLEFYYDIGESIVQNGFRRLLFVNGHGSNVNIMNLAARLVTLRTPGLAAATSWWDLFREERSNLRESTYPGGMAHACEYETSAYMYLEPELVREDLIEDCISTMNNQWTFSDVDGSGPIHLVPWWSQTSGNGSEGQASLATADKGEAFVSSAVNNLISYCEFFRDTELPPIQDRRPADLRWTPTRR
jgi:creatinine amidohydrolase